jgi:arylsulfatase A-like enzyme
MDERPNILFFFPDQLRHDWTGLNPDLPVRTPNVSRLAAEGASFSRAITPSPLCAPCRAALMSGKEYDRCRVPTNGTDYPLDQTAFTHLLRDSGYHTMGCGKFDLHKATFDWGLDGRRLLEEWGFSDGIDNEGKWDGIASGREQPRGPYLQHLEERGLRQAHIDDFERRRVKDATHATLLPDDAYCDNWVAANGLKLLRRAPAGRPWFLQVNFTGPHDPWDITESMTALYDGADFPPAHGDESLPPERHVAVRRNYSAMVENIDRWVGIYLDELRARGELDNTLIVFSSDHGEMLGDRGIWGKSVPFRPSINVPLVVNGPGVTGGIVCERPTTILDLTATFLDVAGLPVPEEMDSRSLWPILRGEADAVRLRVVSGLRDWRVVIEGRHKLIAGVGGGHCLYDVVADPWEEDDLAAREPGTVERLAAHLSD